MVTFSTTGSNSTINMADPLLVDFDRLDESQGSGMDPTNFSWYSATDGNPWASDVDINGSGFTYSSFSRELTGGTISSIVIDWGVNNLSNTGDILITGTEGLIGRNINKDDPASFWNEVLKGNDTFDLSGLDGIIDGSNLIFGDDLSARVVHGATTTTDSGGNDTITSGDNEFDLIGDVLTVAGFLDGFSIFRAIYDAGDDRITSGVSKEGESTVLVGDAGQVGQYGILNGGNDRLDSSRTLNAVAVGDVSLQTGGTVNGGNDLLTLNKGFSDNSGDVRSFHGGRLNGGDDRITGSEGQDLVGGDIEFRTGTSGTIIGGNDTILGSGGNDFLFGEVHEGSLAGVSGGNDRIFGQAGADIINGQTGSDRLDGGIDNDRMAGGSGPDVFIFAPGADDDRIADFRDAGSTADDRIDARAYNFTSVNQIGKTADGADLLLDFGGSDTVRLVGYRGDHVPTDINNDFIL